HDVQIVYERAAWSTMGLPATEALAQALEVLPHELDVPDAVGGFLLRHPFDGIEGEEAHAHFAGQRLGEPRADEWLEEDRRDLSLSRRADDGGGGGGARRPLGSEAGHRDLRQAVAAGEIAEGGVRDYDVAARAVAQPRVESRIESGKLLAVGRGIGVVHGLAGGGAPLEGIADRVDLPAGEGRGGPNVRVPALPAGPRPREAGARPGHHPGGRRAPPEPPVPPRPEAGAVVHEDTRVAHLGHVLGRRLPVMTVAPGRHERDHLSTTRRDLARELVHRIEARHHQRFTLGRGRLLAAGEDQDGEERDEARGPIHAGRPAEGRVSAARSSSMRPKAHTTVAPVGVSTETEAIMAITLTRVPKLQAMASRLETEPPMRFAASVGTMR